MTCPSCPARTVFLPRPTMPSWRGLAGLRGQVRNMLLAACLSLAATMVLHADDAPQSWVPDVLELPADMEVISDRSIGSTLRMFSFTTERDPEALLAEWEAALRANGYAIVQAQSDIVDQAIEFSGERIGNAKIAVAPATADSRAVIEFDATLP